MRLIADARRVVLLSYSWWLGVVGLAVLVGSELAYALWGWETNPYVVWWISVLLLLAGLIGRLVAQTGGVLVNLVRIAALVLLICALSSLAARAAPATEDQTLAVAVPFIEAREGMRLQAYLDIVGVPTICAGSTRGVQMGMRRTLAECRALLRAEVAEYRTALHRYFTADTRARRLPPRRDAAFVSLAYNVGVAGAGRSTAVRRLNAGDVPGACDAITWWDRAGGRVVRGLVLRRAAERDLCRADGW